MITKTFPQLTDFQITETMLKHGGGFVAALAKAYRLADDTNGPKLKAAFPDYWQKYAERTVRCPECGKTTIMHRHHDGDTCGLPECDFLECEDCQHQWGHN